MFSMKDIPPEQMESLQNAFDAFDSNGDGYLEHNELDTALRALGFNPKQHEIHDMIEDVGKAPIDFKAFVYIVYRHSRCVDVEQELVDAFRVFDLRGTGRLPEEKVRSILRNIKKPLSDNEISEIISRTKPDGKMVNYSSFVHEMLNL